MRFPVQPTATWRDLARCQHCNILKIAVQNACYPILVTYEFVRARSSPPFGRVLKPAMELVPYPARCRRGVVGRGGGGLEISSSQKPVLLFSSDRLPDQTVAVSDFLVVRSHNLPRMRSPVAVSGSWKGLWPLIGHVRLGRWLRTGALIAYPSQRSQTPYPPMTVQGMSVIAG
ncbi:hypothetical protein V2G26_015896 [Clonostachys chloroleuca]